jgi:hypothetical protein
LRGKNESKSLPILFVEKQKNLWKKIIAYHRNYPSLPYKTDGARSGMLLQYLYESLIQFGVK